MKNCIALAIVLFCTDISFSQELELGIKGGATFANITDATGNKNKTGFQAGVFVGIKPNEHLVIQPEVLFSQQGAEFDIGNFELSYINVPLIIKYYLFRGFNLQLGPQFGFLIDDKFESSLGDVTNQLETESFDLSAVGGVGVDFNMGIRIDGRYHYGITDIYNQQKGKNQVFSIAIGYNFL